MQIDVDAKQLWRVCLLNGSDCELRKNDKNDNFLIKTG